MILFSLPMSTISFEKKTNLLITCYCDLGGLALGKNISIYKRFTFPLFGALVLFSSNLESHKHDIEIASVQIL